MKVVLSKVLNCAVTPVCVHSSVVFVPISQARDEHRRKLKEKKSATTKDDDVSKPTTHSTVSSSKVSHKKKVLGSKMASAKQARPLQVSQWCLSVGGTRTCTSALPGIYRWSSVIWLNYVPLGYLALCTLCHMFLFCRPRADE